MVTSLFSINPDGCCLLGHHILHPGGGQLAAARQDMAGLLGGAQENDVLVIAGAGLGWHLKAALTKLAPEQIIVYQLLPEEKNWCWCLGPELPALTIVDNRQDMAEALGQRLVYGRFRRAAVFAAPAYASIFAREVEQVRQMVNRALSRAGKDQQTKALLSQTWNKHLAKNLDIVFTLPDVISTAGAMSGLPALIVGAGPSLDQSLPALSNMRNQALVMGAASILGPFAARGLKPHMVAALEGKDESRQFVNVDFKQTCLMASLNGHPNHFALWPGSKAFFHANAWLPALLNFGGVLPTGGHATSAAFSLACLWGCNPIILLGQDLAYTGGRAHASARPGGEDEEQKRTISVPALGGGMVETSTVMQSYLEWYEEAAAHLRARYPHIRVINATAAGADIAGFAWEKLEEVMATLPVINDPGASLLNLFQKTPRLNPMAVRARVEQAARLLQRPFSSFAELGQALQNTPLAAWLDEEAAHNWRKALAQLRLIVNALAARLA